MNSKEIIVIYKEVGKQPIFQKIQNTIEIFEELLGGKVDILPFENIFIVCRKDRETLKPNVYINSFGKVDSSIRGNLFIINKENDTFKSLSKVQAIKYSNLLIKESFNYSHFDENGKYLSNKTLKKRRKLQRQNEKANSNNDTAETTLENKNTTNSENDEDNNSDEVLEMILQIQSVILQFIREYYENK